MQTSSAAAPNPIHIAVIRPNSLLSSVLCKARILVQKGNPLSASEVSVLHMEAKRISLRKPIDSAHDSRADHSFDSLSRANSNSESNPLGLVKGDLS